MGSRDLPVLDAAVEVVDEMYPASGPPASPLSRRAMTSPLVRGWTR
ncbi:MAG TPA: hypothetical protein VHJ18_18680 [Streptosporangiaceae bacterium]|nr:hypothetical protein [Streptosporangiaceae bacterium]